MPELVDLSGPIHPAMWHYRDPYFAPEIEELPRPDWLENPVHSEQVRMPLQTGSYVETSAHVFPDDPRVTAYPLERTVLLPTACVLVPKGPGEGVTGEEVRAGLDRLGVADPRGMGLLVGTGWDARWDEPGFTDDCPYFDDSVVDLVLEAGFSLLGGDTPRFENPAAPSGHLRRMFAERVLLLAPLRGLAGVGDRVGRLIAPPLNIPAASATPCRPVLVLDDRVA